MCLTASHFEDIVSLDSAVKILKGCKIALQFAPIPGIAAVVDVLLELVGKVKLTKTNQQMLVELGEELLGISSVVSSALRTVENHLGKLAQHSAERRQLEEQFSEPSSLLQQRAQNLCKELESLNAQADVLRRGRFLPRCLRSKRNSRILEELKRGAGVAVQHFRMSSGITVEALVDDIANRTTVIQDRVIVIQEQICDVQEMIKKTHEEEQAERDEADLKELPHDDMCFRTVPQLGAAQYVEGTSRDALEDLNAWAEGRPTGRWCKPIWVLSAPAGSGKSTIASKFAEHLHDQGTLGASVFSNASSHDRASVQRFFSTIAYQLARSQPALRPHIAAAAREHLRNGRNQQMAFECKNLVLKPLAQLPEDHPLFVIVVDGLDECAEDAPGAVTQLLEHLIACAQLPSVRVLMTYRSRCGIVEKVLQDPKRQAVVHHLQFVSNIGVFLTAQLAGLTCINSNAIETIASHTRSSLGYALAVVDFLHADPEHAADRLAIVLSLGPCRGESESVYALYPTVTRHAHAYRLTAAQWTKMRRRVERPAVFSLCSGPVCYKHVTDWLLAPHTDVASAGIIPLELLNGLCNHCNAVVGNQPLEMWVLKRIISALKTDGVDPANIFPSISSAGASQAQGQSDAWLPTPRAGAGVVRCVVTPMHTQGAKHAQDVPQPSRPSPTTPPPAYEAPAGNSSSVSPAQTAQIPSPTDTTPSNAHAASPDTQLIPSGPSSQPRKTLAHSLTLSILSLPSSNARTSSPRTGTPRTSTPRTYSPGRTPRTGTPRTPRTAWTPLARHNRVALMHILATPIKYAVADPWMDVRRMSTAVGAMTRQCPRGQHAGWVRLVEVASDGRPPALRQDAQAGVSRSQGASPVGREGPAVQSKRFTM
ncbi:hypothetical protein GY45DRAFT_1431505 [Cubamyces sp. BRFM 1775]|nr:hypothetical protein GY45DRAFT_1431505 [Cubamyces sp. BRFM 1775]